MLARRTMIACLILLLARCGNSLPFHSFPFLFRR
jgi:hypothetical protein